MKVCVDKYLVREYVESCGCSKYLNELYYVYDNVAKIKWELLPNKFVLKTSDGGGGENIFICKNKMDIDMQKMKETVDGWRFKEMGTLAYEWAYVGAQHSYIIIEKYLEDLNNSDLSISDYKFFCFNGQPKFLVVDVDRYSGHKRNFFDINWRNLNILSDCPNSEYDIPCPVNFNDMIVVAEKLSKGFPFVRVDLYNIEGHILFGEMTFYPWSGFVQFNPDEFDYIWGEYFSIDF